MSFSKAAGAASRTIATAAGETKASADWGDALFKWSQVVVAGVTAGGVVWLIGRETHKVGAKLAELDTRLTERMASLNQMVDTKVAGVKETVTKEVDAKETVTKEVDAKVAGVSKEVDAKVAGVKETVTKEVDAKVAGLEKAAADKAKAEALSVLKDYGVSYPSAAPAHYVSQTRS